MAEIKGFSLAFYPHMGAKRLFNAKIAVSFGEMVARLLRAGGPTWCARQHMAA
jgi:hypothetical protein